jgi:hypothetical protein
VSEGQLADDFTGRKWEVNITVASVARKERAENAASEKEGKQKAQQEADARTVVHAHSVNDPDNLGVSFTALRNATNLSNRRFGPAVTWAIEHEMLEETAGNCEAGNGAKRKARILKRCQETLA